MSFIKSAVKPKFAFWILLMFLYPVFSFIHEIGHAMACAISGYEPKIVELGLTTCSIQHTSFFILCSGGLFAALILLFALIILAKIKGTQNEMVLILAIHALVQFVNAAIESFLSTKDYIFIANNLIFLSFLIMLCSGLYYIFYPSFGRKDW